eukprot:1159052-Pelagomonas_calceolata.AAC.7
MQASKLEVQAVRSELEAVRDNQVGGMRGCSRSWQPMLKDVPLTVLKKTTSISCNRGQPSCPPTGMHSSHLADHFGTALRLCGGRSKREVLAGSQICSISEVEARSD